MEGHVSTPLQPPKKRYVRQMADETDASISHPNSKFLPPTPDDGTPKHEQSVSLLSSRRSSDSGIVSPRPTADPSDSESTCTTLPSPGRREAETVRPITSPGKGNKSEDGTAKRTPFCGRCRNHWPDKPVLVKGHKKVCPMRNCNCSMCRLTLKRQRVMATQVRVRRSQASHKKTADILQIAAKADTIDIDLDDDPESGAGFAMRFQPKIPPDLLSSLQSSEDTRKKFRSFLEPKINEMITAFFDQQNAVSGIAGKKDPDAGSAFTSSIHSKYIGMRKKSMDVQPLIVKPGLCQSTGIEQKIHHNPHFYPFVFCPQPTFSGHHSFPPSNSSPSHRAGFPGHHYVQCLSLDATRRLSTGPCDSSEPPVPVPPSPDQYTTWNSDLPLPVFFGAGTVRAA